jgi:hypothetical protein
LASVLLMISSIVPRRRCAVIFAFCRGSARRRRKGERITPQFVLRVSTGVGGRSIRFTGCSFSQDTRARGAILSTRNMSDKIAVAEGLIICNINNNMARKTTLIILLFICSLLPLAAEEASPGSGRGWRPVLGLGIQGGVAVADDPVGFPPEYAEFYTPKAQAVGALGASLDFPLFSGSYLGLGLQLHSVTASSPAGGWTYRGHWGGGLRLSAGYGFELPRPAGSLRLSLGASAGGSFNFDLITFTSLFIYYPGIFLQPYLELDNPARKRRSIALVMPIDYYFRRDLEFYGSIGFGVVWRYTRK